MTQAHTSSRLTKDSKESREKKIYLDAISAKNHIMFRLLVLYFFRSTHPLKCHHAGHIFRLLLKISVVTLLQRDSIVFERRKPPLLKKQILTKLWLGRLLINSASDLHFAFLLFCFFTNLWTFKTYQFHDKTSSTRSESAATRRPLVDTKFRKKSIGTMWGLGCFFFQYPTKELCLSESRRSYLFSLFFTVETMVFVLCSVSNYIQEFSRCL